MTDPLDTPPGLAPALWLAEPLPTPRLCLGAGWRLEAQPVGFLDTVLGRDTPIDVDLAALLLSDQGQCLDQVWYRQVRSQDDAIRHQGDRVAGQASESLQPAPLEDLETIELDLDRVSPAVASVWLAVGISTGHQFSDLSAAHCRLFARQRDGQGQEFLQVLLPTQREGNTLVVARLDRSPADPAQWLLTRMLLPGQLDSLADLATMVQAQLSGLRF